MSSSYYNIFFILTYPESYNGYVEISTEDPGYTTLQVVHSKIINYNKENYNVSVYTFEVIPSKLVRDKETDKYSLNILLTIKNILFNSYYNGKIEYNELRSQFIYNFKFENCQLTSAYTLSKLDKIKLYEEALTLLQSEPGDSLSNEFSVDTIDSIIKDKTFDMECFLELLKYCHTTKKIIYLLKHFKLENCEIKMDSNIQNYSPILDKIDSEPEKYTKHSNNNDEIINCKNNFYDLLLFFRMNYEKGDKLKNLLNRKELWEYYAERINFNENLYPLVSELEEDFIKLIMKQKKLSLELVKEIIFSLDTLENVISFIDNHLDKIKEICKKEECHKMIRSSTQENIFKKGRKLKDKNESPSEKLREKIKDILKSKVKRKYQFFLFDDKFWDNNFTFDKIKLFLIDDSLIICQKINKKFKVFKIEENINISKKSNIDFLNCLQKDFDSYYKMNYEIYYCDSYSNRKELYVQAFRTLSIFNKIKIKNLDDEFFKKWNEIKGTLFELKDIRYILEPKDIVSKINNMNDFEKIVKLFYIGDVYNNNIDFESFYEFNLANLLSNKLLYLLEDYNLYNNIPQNIFFIINLLIKKSYEKGILSFLTSIESILPQNIIYEAYILLSEGCKNIPNEIIGHMGNYIIEKKEISVIKKLNNIKHYLISNILYKIDLKIKEEMLYDSGEINIHFELLKKIEQEKVIKDYSLYEKNLNNICLILDNIYNGKVSFSLMDSKFQYSEKLFVNKLSILLFNDKERIKICVNKIKDYLYKIKNEIRYIKESNEINKEFYHDNYFFDDYDGRYLNETLKKIEQGNLNIINDVKSDLEKIHKKFPDIFKTYIMKNSIYFRHEFNANKGQKKIDEIFRQVKRVFEELKLLFEKNWECRITKEKILKYYKIIKEEENKKDKNLFLTELKILMNYHGLYETDKEIKIIKDKIFIYTLKQTNLDNINSCLNLISNENSDYFNQYREELLKMKNIISYKNLDEINEAKELIQRMTKIKKDIYNSNF